MTRKLPVKRDDLTPAVFTMEFFSVDRDRQDPFIICLETKEWFRFEAGQPDDDWEFRPQDFQEIQCQKCPRRHRLLSLMQALNWGLLEIRVDHGLSSREATRQGWRRGARRLDGDKVTPLQRPS